MTDKTLFTALHTLPLFEGETPEALAWVGEYAREAWYQAGEVLLQPGDTNEQLMVVLDGDLRVELEADGKVAISHFKHGDCVGELSVLDGKPVAAYVIADSSCHLLLLPRDAVWKLVDSSHTVARNLLHMLSGRIRHDNCNLSASVRQQRLCERNARIDVLTGLNNRRWLEETLPQLMESSRRNGSPLALLMLDVDNFKPYNDTHGHQAGDLALQAVGSALLENLRPEDVAVRYGGEEFMVVLPNTALAEMGRVAERLRVMLRSQAIVSDEGMPLPSLTVSIGAAMWRQGESLEGLVAAADAALYQAKREGRDRVVTRQA